MRAFLITWKSEDHVGNAFIVAFDEAGARASFNGFCEDSRQLMTLINRQPATIEIAALEELREGDVRIGYS